MKVCSLDAMRAELRNTMEHGLKKHKGDWFHEWARTRKGTLSWAV